MTEPTTEAGRLLLDDVMKERFLATTANEPVMPESDLAERIAAIEAEARHDAEERVRELEEALRDLLAFATDGKDEEFWPHNLYDGGAREHPWRRAARVLTPPASGTGARVAELETALAAVVTELEHTATPRPYATIEALQHARAALAATPPASERRSESSGNRVARQAAQRGRAMTEPCKRNCMPDDHELTRMERLGIVRDWLGQPNAVRVLARAYHDAARHSDCPGDDDMLAAAMLAKLRDYLTEQRQREAARGTQPRGAEWWTAPSTYFDPDESP